MLVLSVCRDVDTALDLYTGAPLVFLSPQRPLEASTYQTSEFVPNKYSFLFSYIKNSARRFFRLVCTDPYAVFLRDHR